MQKVILLIVVCSGAVGAKDPQNSFKKKSLPFNIYNSLETHGNVYDYSTPYSSSLPLYKISDSIYTGPKYKTGRPHSFGYRVRDDYAGLAFGHKQDSDGHTVTGSYDTLLPDGRLQRVTYIADENGYRANVKYVYGSSPGALLKSHDSHELEDIFYGHKPPVYAPHPVVYQINRRPHYVRQHLY